MKKMNANETLKELNYIFTNDSCGSCSCVVYGSTCKCFNQVSEVNDIRDVYKN